MEKDKGDLIEEVKERNTLNNKKCNNYELNLYDFHGEYGIGYCSNTNSQFYFDMEDYNKIKDFCWYESIDQTGYHSLRTKHPLSHKIIKMHRLLGFKNYDHIDRNPLNNRKYNLRPASTMENCRNRDKYKNNTSGFIGVTWRTDRAKWLAFITVNYKRIKLGTFSNKQDAIVARLQAELKYFGPDFAPQRHLFEEYGIITQKGGR